MVTRDDRRAAAILLVLALAGTAVRLLGPAGAPAGSVGYREGGDSRPGRKAVTRAAERAAEPLGAAETIDVNVAGAAELVRLPRIGPALAARIVRDRAEQGPFGSLEALDRVPGIGPAVLDAIRPHVRVPAERATGRRRSRLQKVSLNTATPDDLAQLPGIGPARARAIIEYRNRFGAFRRVEDLARVRGIGGAMVERLRPLVTVR